MTTQEEYEKAQEVVWNYEDQIQSAAKLIADNKNRRESLNECPRGGTHDFRMIGHQGNGHRECTKCRKQIDL